MNREMKRSTSCRRQALTFMGSVLVLALLVGPVILYRYVNRPMFANYFGRDEFSILPYWQIHPRFLKHHLLLVDRRLNLLFLADTGNDVGGHLELSAESGDDMFSWEGRMKTKIHRERDRLILVTDSGERTFRIEAGDAERFESLSFGDPQSLKRELDRLISAQH